MRDDLQSLFDSLVSLYEEKLFLIQLFDKNAAAFSSLADSGDFAAAEDIALRDEQLTESINTVDFEAASIRRKICSAAGISITAFDRLSFDCSQGKQIAQIQKQISTILSDNLRKRQSAAAKLEKEMSGISKTIEDLSSISYIKKHLQSR